mgnify:CR=1 FL=1
MTKRASAPSLVCSNRKTPARAAAEAGREVAAPEGGPPDLGAIFLPEDHARVALHVDGEQHVGARRVALREVGHPGPAEPHQFATRRVVAEQLVLRARGRDDGRAGALGLQQHQARAVALDGGPRRVAHAEHHHPRRVSRGRDRRRVHAARDAGEIDPRDVVVARGHEREGARVRLVLEPEGDQRSLRRRARREGRAAAGRDAPARQIAQPEHVPRRALALVRVDPEQVGRRGVGPRARQQHRAVTEIRLGDELPSARRRRGVGLALGQQQPARRLEAHARAAPVREQHRQPTRSHPRREHRRRVHRARRALPAREVVEPALREQAAVGGVERVRGVLPEPERLRRAVGAGQGHLVGRRQAVVHAHHERRRLARARERLVGAGRRRAGRDEEGEQTPHGVMMAARLPPRRGV